MGTAFQQSHQLFTLVPDGVCKLLGLLEQIIADLTLGLSFLVVKLANFLEDGCRVRREVRCEPGVALGSLIALSVEPAFQSREFFMDKSLQRFQVATGGITNIERFFLQGFFESRKALLVVPHVRSENNIPDFIDITRARIAPAGIVSRRLSQTRRRLGVKSRLRQVHWKILILFRAAVR